MAASKSNKTEPTGKAVEKYLAAIKDSERQTACEKIADMMAKVTRREARMWGAAIVGYGSYHYKYASGREGDFMITGFSNRAQNISVYVMDGFPIHAELMEKLGKFKTGKSCLYIKRLEDIHFPTLRKIIAASVKNMRAKYKCT